MKPVFIDAAARAAIDSEAVKRRVLETGGALFGWEAREGIVIACVSGPGPRAKHRPRRFEPHRQTTSAAMKAVTDASDGRYGYLGSWHTHPLGAPFPSGIDAATAGGLSAQEDLLLPRPVLLILGTSGYRRSVAPEELRAWRWEPAMDMLLTADIVETELPERFCPDEHQLFLDDDAHREPVDSGNVP